MDTKTRRRKNLWKVILAKHDGSLLPKLRDIDGGRKGRIGGGWVFFGGCCVGGGVGGFRLPFTKNKKNDKSGLAGEQPNTSGCCSPQKKLPNLWGRK